MIKSPMPGMSGAGLMTDTLEFVKNLWGGMNIPGVVVPSISVDELDKKIGDLKAVESWLNLNMTMLRSSIQALEVQRATIATLKAMSETMSSSAKPSEAAKPGFMSSPFASAFAFPTTAAAPAPAAESAAAAATAAKPAAAEAPHADATASDNAQSAPKEAAEKESKSGARPDLNVQMANPAAWWNMLQDQFRLAVSNAVASEAAESDTGKADKKAAPGSKTASKSAGADPATAAKRKAAPRKRVAPKA